MTLYGNRDLCHTAMQEMGALQYAIKTLYGEEEEDTSRATSSISKLRRSETENLLNFLQLCNMEPAKVV